MKPLIPLFTALCLCLSPAFAQSDPGDGEQSGLDVFYVSMTKADAKDLGAKTAGKGQMKGKVTWGDAEWQANLTMKGDAATMVVLSSPVANDKVYQMLQDMEERLYVPLYISREVKGKEKNRDFTDLAVKGKTEEQRSEILQNEIGAYADQEDGNILIMFAPSSLLEQMVDTRKKKGDEDAALADFAETIIYSMGMDKKTDTINVISATFAALSKN